jgi:hypothetical protein
MGDIVFRNVRSKLGWAWLRHAGWETLFFEKSNPHHSWSASELHYRFMRGESIQELAHTYCDCGHRLTTEQVETALRHEFRRDVR